MNSGNHILNVCGSVHLNEHACLYVCMSSHTVVISRTIYRSSPKKIMEARGERARAFAWQKKHPSQVLEASAALISAYHSMPKTPRQNLYWEGERMLVCLSLSYINIVQWKNDDFPRLFSSLDLILVFFLSDQSPSLHLQREEFVTEIYMYISLFQKTKGNSLARSIPTKAN